MYKGEVNKFTIGSDDNTKPFFNKTEQKIHL